MIISGQRPSMDQEAHDWQMRPRFTGETMGNTNSWEDEDRVFLILRVHGETLWSAHWQHGFLFFCGSERSTRSGEPGERSLGVPPPGVGFSMSSQRRTPSGEP